MKSVSQIALPLAFPLALLLLLGTVPSLAQSTGTIAGTITDPTGAVIPGVQVTAHGNGTGIDRTVNTDSAGTYTIPSLQPGDYRVQVKASGFGLYTVPSLNLPVDQNVTVNAQLKLESAGATVQVDTAAALIDSQTITVGQVIDQQTVQQIPLNGRHFLDLTQLVPGSVVPPASGSLTSASRGLGASSFITSGNREDSANFMINGINLNDLTQGQITFQPSINTTREFKISNSTYSAEYGRSSGSIVNVATRSGENGFHGEAFDYGRNNYFDARNFFNRKPQRQSSLRRQNFGGDFSGPIWRDHTFFFLSYEGLRQSQDILFNSNVPTAAERAAFATSSAGAAYAQLINLIPAGNNATGTVFQGSAPGPVKVDQFSGDLFHKISDRDNIHLYYAWQQDKRTEPNLQGNSIPGFGDHRTAHRQIGTINEIHIFSPTVVNEARLGFNRIAISFQPNAAADPAAYGISTGVPFNQGLPQINVSAIGLNFGGPAGFPQGRFGTTGVFSDTLSLTKGKHTIRTGGEFRRFIGTSFTEDTGSLSFAALVQPGTPTNSNLPQSDPLYNFVNGFANTFAVTPSNVVSRLFIGSAAGFVMDSWKISPRLIAELGFRFEWNGTPVDGGNRLVNFDTGSRSLVRVHQPYNQSYNYEPRVGFSWDALGNTKTVLRGGFGILTDQPTSNVVTGLAGNPPSSNPVSLQVAAKTPILPVGTLNSTSNPAPLGPSAVNPNFHDAYTESYNLNLQQDLGSGTVMQMGYVGSSGRHLRLRRNINQYIYPNGVQSRPYTAVAGTSTIRPGQVLNNISYADSDSFSNYNALWFTVRKSLWHGVDINSTYTWSKSFDLNSLGSQGGSSLQDNFNPRGDYGLSDFDARHHFVFSGVWTLPFHGNRLKEGWMLANITQLQSGNPLNITTTSTYNGISGTVRPTLVGSFTTGRRAVLASGNIPYIQGTACATLTTACTFFAQPTGFGNLRRNALTGPGFADTDLSLQKTTRIFENAAFVLRMDSFDLLNHANFGNPNLSATGSATSTFGQITGTRNGVGDAGSSRQLQFAAKVTF